jgi:glycogen debranching enzyme
MLNGHAHGLFFRDTRFVSELRCTLNGLSPEPLAATAPDPFSGVFVLRGHPSRGHADSHLVLFRRRYVGRGMREDLEVENYGEEAAFCSIEIQIDSDFADLFEVKEGRVQKQGQLDVSAEGSRLTFRYKRHAFERATHVDFTGSPRIHGTHVVYVLHDITKPELYGGLPSNPQIPVTYTAWKRFAKPIGLLLTLFAAPVAFFHYVMEGPKDPQPPDHPGRNISP